MGQAGSHERQRQRPRYTWQLNSRRWQFTCTVNRNGEPQPVVPRNPNAGAPQPAAPAPAASAYPPLHLDRRIARESRDHPEIWNCNPCIARDTWQANRTWKMFVFRFLRNPDPVFLRQGEDECPICFRPYWEDNKMQPVRLPCDSQHLICLYCAIRWFKGGTFLEEAKNKCPCCRQVLFKNNGRRTLEVHRADLDRIFQNLQVMRQTSAEIEQFVTAMWNTALMRYSDEKHEDA